MASITVKAHFVKKTRNYSKYEIDGTHGVLATAVYLPLAISASHINVTFEEDLTAVLPKETT